MAEVRARAVRWVADDFPGWVEVQLADATGRVWSIVDKAPVFVDDGTLSASAAYPIDITVQAVVLEVDDTGSALVRLDHGLSASDGTEQFTVPVENVRMSEDLYISQELVDVERTTPQYDGKDVPIDTGRLLLHAVREADETAPLCGLNQRGVIATGWLWKDSVPDHLERCSACAGLVN